MRDRKVRVGIIGSGPSGCAAAYSTRLALEKAGLHGSITILESTNRVGGKIHTQVDEYGIFERGAEAIVLKVPALKELFESLNLKMQRPSKLPFGIAMNGVIKPVDPRLLQPFPKNIAALLTSSLFSFSGKTRAALGILLGQINRGSVTDLPLGKSLRKRWGEEVSSILEICLGNIHGGDVNKLSTEVYYPKLLRQVSDPDIRAGSLITSFVGGMGTLTDALLTRSGAEIRVNKKISGISKVDGTWRVKASDGTHEDFEALVLSTPGKGLFNLLRPILPEIDTWSSSMVINSGATVTYIFSSLRLPPITGYLVPLGRLRGVSGVTLVSNKWKGRIKDDFTAIRVFIRGGDGQNDPVRVGLEEIQRTLGIFDSPLSTQIDHWKDAFPMYPVGSKKIIETLSSKADQIGGLFVPQSSFLGTGVADAIRFSLPIGEKIVKSLESVDEMKIANCDDQNMIVESRYGI